MKSSVEFCNKLQNFLDSKLLQFFINEGIDRDICSFVISAIVEKLYKD